MTLFNIFILLYSLLFLGWLVETTRFIKKTIQNYKKRKQKQGGKK